MHPPTPPAAHPAPHIGSASDSSLASSYPASCSPQLPFAFTPSQHWLASLQEHQVSWLLPVQRLCKACSVTVDAFLIAVCEGSSLLACLPAVLDLGQTRSLLCCFVTSQRQLWAAACCMMSPDPAPQESNVTPRGSQCATCCPPNVQGLGTAVSPSPPISGRDVSALAVIRRPSWSSARTSSSDGVAAAATGGVVGYSVSPVQVRASQQITGNRSMPLERCEACSWLWGCLPPPMLSNSCITLSYSVTGQLHFEQAAMPLWGAETAVCSISRLATSADLSGWWWQQLLR